MRRTVHGIDVRGREVGPETRCAHYDTERDVIALRFPCCDDYFPCHECHDAVTSHDSEVWPPDSADAEAILCGCCGARLTIRTYLNCENRCPTCAAAFNPGCRNHAHYYFSEELVRAITE